MISDLFAPSGYEAVSISSAIAAMSHTSCNYTTEGSEPDFLGDVELYDMENDSAAK